MFNMCYVKHILLHLIKLILFYFYYISYLKKLLVGHEKGEGGSHRELPPWIPPGYSGLIRVNIRYGKNGERRENFNGAG